MSLPLPKKIWCFGDSLTTGSTFIEGRKAFSPYTAFLEELYKAKSSADEVPHILNHGVSGETSNEIATRFQTSAEINIAPEDAVVILCGTTDVVVLGNAAAEEVIKRITYMAEAVVAAKAALVLVTVPPMSAYHERKSVDSRAQRKQINAHIKGLVASLPRCTCFDLYTAISTEVELKGKAKAAVKRTCLVVREEFSVDSIHFTVEGYQVLAQGVFDAIGTVMARK